MVNSFVVSPVAHGVLSALSVPGDKSISHRAILFAAISNGDTVISHLLFSQDVLMTVNAMRALGVQIDLDPKTQSARVFGVGLHGLKAPAHPIDCGNSGTTMRLLAGLLAGQPFDSVLIGDESLMKRPMARVAEPLRLMGAKILLSPSNTAPITIIGGQTLKAIVYTPVVASAQVKSCVLLAGLYASGKTCVQEPIKTRDHTERLLKQFYDQSLSTIEIPGDLSSAAFFVVAAAIIPGSDVCISQVGVNPYRTGVIDILKQMGAAIDITHHGWMGVEPVANIRVRYVPLQGISISPTFVALAIDEFPALFVAAACARGKTVLRGAKELRVKETDRLAAMASGLRTLGVPVTEFEDGLEIEGVDHLGGGCVDSFGDHRIAMAFAIAATRATAPVEIQNTDCIATSFPDFVALSRKIGLSIKEPRAQATG